MKFLTKEDRENLFAELEQLQAEIRERNQRIWLIDTILLTGSLIAAFQSEIVSILLPIAAIALVSFAFIQHITGQEVNAVAFETITEIRHDLVLTKTEHMYESKLEGKSWFIFRSKVPYGIFIFLIVIYFYLLIPYL